MIWKNWTEELVQVCLIKFTTTITKRENCCREFSCSAKFVFVKEKRWLCQSTEASCNALVGLLRPYLKVNRLLRAFN